MCRTLHTVFNTYCSQLSKMFILAGCASRKRVYNFVARRVRIAGGVRFQFGHKPFFLPKICILPPQNAIYICPELFEELENDIEKFSAFGSILLWPDFNSRTGKYSDNGCKEGGTIITNDQSEFSLCAIPFSDTALITN